MNKKMLIDAARPEQVRVAIVEDSKLTGLEIETADGAGIKGNVYQAVVKGVEPSLEASFLDFGGERDGFLTVDDVRKDLGPGKPLSGRPKIRELLKRRQQVLVQVTKDAVSTKGATLTTFISLAGRYVVLMPGADSTGGISRKLDDEKRQRLREILDKLKIPEGTSVILRTAGFDQTKTSLQRDINRLANLWKGIRTRAEKTKGTALIYREGDLVLRTLRDYFDNDVTEVWISSPEAFERADAYCKAVMPKLRKRLKLYEDPVPLFARYQVEEQVAALADRRVPLPSGGSLVIDPTEALVAIDVNSGRTRRDKDPEENALQANLEAAREIGRQLRLRDLGGIVVIDFIDLYQSKNRRKVEKEMKDAMKGDRARVRIAKISTNGLLELTRQRIKKAARTQTNRVCPTCEGSGWIRSPAAAALDVLRRVRAQAARGGLRQVRISLHPELAEYLQNAERATLVDLEKTYEIEIVILFGPGLTRDQQEIEFVSEQSETGGPTRGRGRGRRKPAKAAPAQTPLGQDSATDESTPPEAAPKKKPARKRPSRRRKKKPAANGDRAAPTEEQGQGAAGTASSAPTEETGSAPTEKTAENPAEAAGQSPTETPPNGDKKPKRRRRGRRGGRGRGRKKPAAKPDGDPGSA